MNEGVKEFNQIVATGQRWVEGKAFKRSLKSRRWDQNHKAQSWKSDKRIKWKFFCLLKWNLTNLWKREKSTDWKIHDLKAVTRNNWGRKRQISWVYHQYWEFIRIWPFATWLTSNFQVKVWNNWRAKH